MTRAPAPTAAAPEPRRVADAHRPRPPGPAPAGLHRGTAPGAPTRSRARPPVRPSAPVATRGPVQLHGPARRRLSAPPPAPTQDRPSTRAPAQAPIRRSTPARRPTRSRSPASCLGPALARPPAQVGPPMTRPDPTTCQPAAATRAPSGSGRTRRGPGLPRLHRPRPVPYGSSPRRPRAASDGPCPPSAWTAGPRTRPCCAPEVCCAPTPRRAPCRGAPRDVSRAERASARRPPAGVGVRSAGGAERQGSASLDVPQYRKVHKRILSDTAELRLLRR